MYRIAIGVIALGLAACTSNDANEPRTSRSSSEPLELIDETVERAAAERPLLPLAAPGDFSVFVPKDQANGVKLDFATWDDMLGAIVFNMGPSTRQSASTPTPPTGTRFVQGHDSPLRLEGNRVFFSFMNDELIDALTEYKKDLIAIGDRYDIAAMAKNQQLAYWINLHNVTVIEAVARNYPVKRPSSLKFGEDKALLDEALLVTIRGVPLSLKDIREEIVYKNWSSPRVIYGFFRGDIGGPRIHTRAFTAATVASRLDANAREFANSLRGVSEGRATLRVSRVYDEARPFYFPNWPVDLRAHLRNYMRDDVLEDVNLNAPLEVNRYEADIADMAGGDTTTSLAATQTRDLSAIGGAFAYSPGAMPPQVRRIYREMQVKLQELQQRGWARGTVVIEDVPTEDPTVD